MSRFSSKELIKSFHLAYLLWSSDHFPRIETHLTAILRFSPFLATDQLEVTPSLLCQGARAGQEVQGANANKSHPAFLLEVGANEPKRSKSIRK